MLDGTTGFYRMQRYRVGDFFGLVNIGIHLAFKHNAMTIGAGLLAGTNISVGRIFAVFLEGSVSKERN